MTAIYHWEGSGATLPKFERRTTICSAADEDTAIATLLQEARDYPDEHMTFLDDYCIEEIDEPPGTKPVEVACEMTIGVDPESGKIITPEKFQEQYWWIDGFAGAGSLRRGLVFETKTGG